MGVRGCLTALARQDSAKPSDARPAPGPTNAKPHARFSSRLRGFFAAACLVLGCLLLVKAAPSDWSSSHSPRPVALSADRSQPQYITSNIEDLRVGGWVLAADPQTGKLHHRRIVDAFARTVTRLRVLDLRGPHGRLQTLRTTDEHPFWVPDAQRFVAAGELAAGDELLGPRGERQQVVSSHSEAHPEGVRVYNFEVEGAHTYFVLAGDLPGVPALVHNGCGGPHGNSKASTKPNHVYEIRNKLTGDVKKYGISGGRIRADGKSYRAEAQVRAMNRKAGADIYESRILARNLTRPKALSMEQGRVNGYSIAAQRSGAAPRTGPPSNKLPQPRIVE